ncbi:MAG TPA: hypothetical protein VFA24_02350 [Gaiellaceae bacterium]|nr:hypothetical protein [Gaiellaceae bacterium]
MTHPPRNIVRNLLLLAMLVAGFALLAASVGAGSAAAKSTPPCWKSLINDWYDGRIDRTYPIQCYRDALKHLPTDVETYSSARDDIKQALQKRITQGRKGGSTTTGGGPSSSGPGSGPGGSNTNGPGGPQSNPSSPIKNAFDATKGKNADSVPIPLIVLGAVALLLMGLGAAGFLARRTRTRRLQLASAAAKPPRQGS